ncbi:nucleoside monophosphate kinase [Chlamydiifrater phoenicopteri]|uniref:nucleoside monophosphate kinase n=1 Tax=Chlamydiifrater phoenicopteri TaxID=2681469 RepID=UPI001FE28AB2|nr:nucleoside monophosphate kinase [Chlamydiifrater phoenicopteri]
MNFISFGMFNQEIIDVIKPYSELFSTILLFGPPGVGKDLLGNFLSQSGSQCYVSMGDVFRCYSPESPIRRMFHRYAVSGALIPDEIVINVWQYYVQGLIATGKYLPERQDLLLSGVPRTLGQCQLLESFTRVRHVIVLEAFDESELLARTQKLAHTRGLIGEVGLDVLKRRLESYYKDIEELIAFYPKHKVSRIQAEQKPFEVLRDVLSRLSHVLSDPCAA